LHRAPQCSDPRCTVACRESGTCTTHVGPQFERVAPRASAHLMRSLTAAAMSWLNQSRSARSSSRLMEVRLPALGVDVPVRFLQREADGELRRLLLLLELDPLRFGVLAAPRSDHHPHLAPGAGFHPYRPM